eukprot:scaffold20170_cov78-Isochrysis_galbana.AAC.2
MAWRAGGGRGSRHRLCAYGVVKAAHEETMGTGEWPGRGMHGVASAGGGARRAFVSCVLLPARTSYCGTPSASGRRSDGVPLNPMRCPKTIAPPSSCPDADSLRDEKDMVAGKTKRSSSSKCSAGVSNGAPAPPPAALTSAPPPAVPPRRGMPSPANAAVEGTARLTERRAGAPFHPASRLGCRESLWGGKKPAAVAAGHRRSWPRGTTHAPAGGRHPRREGERGLPLLERAGLRVELGTELANHPREVGPPQPLVPEGCGPLFPREGRPHFQRVGRTRPGCEEGVGGREGGRPACAGEGGSGSGAGWSAGRERACTREC